MTTISRSDLHELIAYLEECLRNGKGADLPGEWANQLLLVLNAAGEAQPSNGDHPHEPVEEKTRAP
jgi:hypothetical protein